MELSVHANAPASVGRRAMPVARFRYAISQPRRNPAGRLAGGQLQKERLRATRVLTLRATGAKEAETAKNGGTRITLQLG